MTSDDMLDLLASVGEVIPRRMFGGTGFYKNGIMFALEAYGRLFLKTDEENRQIFIDAGCEPFKFVDKDGNETVMSYWEPPESALSSPMKMKPWALLGVEASLRNAKPKSKKKNAPKVKAEGKAAVKETPKPKTKKKAAAKKAARKK
ncbi:DNA transformation protein [Roseimicrobium gellanilyticum]|uniref:DNA transformation protein n=1 Tax=Roseimicrobium gellanilyticum TaxID=748857 RepID=A0A366HDI1_9BACT|nr:TfoX/Sxy family protein [Roseimicrobium gellanilyticum]RBP40511.1 DNA transformation protein [Roseimicrobium gellanilyticum]